MIEDAELVQTLERVLADQTVFISKLQGMDPGSKTRDEVLEIEEEIHEAIDLMKEALEGVIASKPSPEIIGDRLKRSFENLSTIYDLLTKLLKERPE